MGGGLLCGLTPWHVRVLTDGEWSGGKGMRLEEVARMTLDQVFMSLVDRKHLQSRRREMDSLAAAGSLPTESDGTVKGRSADDRVMHARIVGKSRARQLMEAARERERTARQPRRRRR